MTDLTFTSWDCACDPNIKVEGGKSMQLAITEGNTTVWVCPHVHAYEKQTTRKWITKQ